MLFGRLSAVKVSRVAGAALLLCALPSVPAVAKVPTAEIDGNKIKLEVASTREQITRGLMYRTSMPEDHGMVFLFRPPLGVKFWMAHCFISLDMLMIKDGKIVKIFENVPPERDKPEQECPTYPPANEPPITVSEVVEVNGGYAKRHHIKEGDTVEFSFGTHGAEAGAAPAKTAAPATK
ncbi:MAG TPA: DUF192 domain-containing protein [Candidatus Obscuribacterales bacterium]